MNINQQGVEKETTLHEGLPFVEEQDVAAGDFDTPAYTITGPDDTVISIDAGTQLAPEFRSADGSKLDGSARIVVHKCDKHGNKIAGGIVFSDTLNRFNYDKMRVEPDYHRKTTDALMIAPKEIVKVFVEVPEGSEGFAAGQSNLQIGDDTSDFGVPVEIVEMQDLSAAEQQAVKAASQVN